MVESVLIKASGTADEQATQEVLVSWSYQVLYLVMDCPLEMYFEVCDTPWTLSFYISVSFQDEDLGSYLMSLLKKGLP